MSNRPSLARHRRRAVWVSAAAAAVVPTMLVGPGASAATPLIPGNLLVATSTFQPDPNVTAGVTQLPPGCSGSACVTAVASGNYPTVFNNASVDGSFGVTSPIVLQQITPAGQAVNSFEVPNSTDPGVTSSSDQMVTSFSSKSEIALNLSSDGSAVTFMGYDAPVDATDVSNSNTPGALDATNPVAGSYYRVVAQLGTDGAFHFTETNAYSGNNGRAAVYDPSTDTYYTVGNAGNGSNPEPSGVVAGAGAQLIPAVDEAESAQTPGAPTPVGNFNITQLGDAADKSAKDDNFRGLTLSNDVLYVTKGSGGNGVNTVYFLDTSGSACPDGSGVPAAGATLPTTSSLSVSTSSPALGLTTKNPGLSPTNLCILNGFPTTLAKNPTYFPFGLWFANPTTLYVADEGSGTNTYSSTTGTYTAAAASTTAGLEKWIFDSATGQWNLAYTLQSGLDLGQPYTVSGYPDGTNSGPGGTGLPWAPATDGLRNLTGRVNANGSVTIFATTSTVSGSGDQGADPNQLVSITDQPGATSAPSGETFQSVVAPENGVVVRGVSFTPGTTATPPVNTPEVPFAPLLPLSAVAVGGGAVVWQRHRRARRLTPSAG